MKDRGPALLCSRPPRGGARVVVPPLTGPEQHRPVEPGGLGRAPRALARPLRHEPARRTAEPAPREGSARRPVSGARAPWPR